MTANEVTSLICGIIIISIFARFKFAASFPRFFQFEELKGSANLYPIGPIAIFLLTLFFEIGVLPQWLFFGLIGILLVLQLICAIEAIREKKTFSLVLVLLCIICSIVFPKTYISSEKERIAQNKLAMVPKFFPETRILSSVLFSDRTSSDSINYALQNAGLPMRIITEHNSEKYLLIDSVSVSVAIDENCRYEAARIIFDMEEWLRITTIPNPPDTFWICMTREGYPFYEILPDNHYGKGYQLMDHSIKKIGSHADAVVLRYIENGKLDTIPLVEIGE